MKDALNYFSEAGDDTNRGARTKLADALGVTSGAVSQWGELLPQGQAYKLQVITKGKLKVNPSLYQKSAAS